MKIKIDAGFVLCLALIFLFNSCDYALVFLAASLVHELGHLFFLFLFKIKNPELVLGITGAEIFFDTTRLSYQKEALVCLGGAFSNLIFSALCVLVLQSGFNLYVIFFFFANLFYACLNLLPIKSLDGARALECILSLFLPVFVSYRICSVLSKACAVAVVFLIFTMLRHGGANLTLILLFVAMLFQCIPSKPRCLKAS